ncbi:putative C6 transcription factor [Aspergillus fischeri NRRL 181]|uniref:C6 transcription factor, putative n=1 Tax=Neosartorya fischeri (strain ATCC 1020 / DSM 3700 / CBS 544.65 / FGSC A1164 / JCM 1740 / NRRL 181 / WB 181) TaxID=331117 RepID=A1DBK7_NEOFI|nr:C6 transcription factor, putative [Aspergillus fischeri NRRL 181]EAW20247.1 C6 transcription factor, putative [Aspergillus fischeri NRRL 181]
MAYRRLASLVAGQNYAVTIPHRHASGVFAAEISSPHMPAGSDNNWDKKAQSATPPRISRLTSCFGVSSENYEHLNGILAPLATLEHNGTSSSPKQVQLGARLLLTLFENLSFYETLTENRSDNSPEGCVVGQQLVRIIFTALKDNHRLLANGQDAKERYYENLLGWSQKLFAETSQSIEVGPSTTPEEYLRCVSNRWEGIALVFSVVGQGALLERDWKSVSQLAGAAPADQRSLGILAATAGDTCLQFCDCSGIIHDPLGWLLYQHTHLLALIYGNNDYRAWRALAQLATVVFTLGFNQSKVNARMPFFLVELRKRLMASAYIMDKQLATFLGRPPQIIWRYCDVQLPLDLRYDEILADPATRDAAVNRLDANGWNSQGIIQTAQWMRVSLLVGSIREQILELSLSRCVDDLARKAKQVSDISCKTWDELPGFLRWRPGSASSEDSGSLLIPLYLDFLYNDFLLSRLLVRRSQTESDALINVSQTILGTALDLIGREIASGTGTYNIGWNASSFGIPAAGVLAIELLCQSDGSSRSTPSMFRRPETIQNLSVFASYLQYVVLPHEGNYEICQRARRILCRILNQALSVNPPTLPSSVPTSAVAADWLNGESILLDDGTNLLEWIESRLD